MKPQMNKTPSRADNKDAYSRSVLKNGDYLRIEDRQMAADTKRSERWDFVVHTEQGPSLDKSEQHDRERALVK
jgi:hypothetical protein